MSAPRPASDDRRTLLRGAVLNAIGTAAEGARAALPVLFIYLYSSRAYGVFILCFSIVEITSRCVVSGFADGLVYLGARHDGASEGSGDEARSADRLYRVIANSLVWPMALAVAAALVLWAGAGALYERHYAETQPASFVFTVRTLALLLPLNVLIAIPMAAIKARLMMGYDVVISNGALPLATVVLLIALKIAGVDESALAIAQIGGGVVAGTLAVWAYATKFSLRRTIGALRRFRLDREVLDFSLPQCVNNLAGYGTARIDAVILAAYARPETVALYSIAVDVARVLRTIKQNFNGVFSPLVARKLGAGDRAGMQDALDLVTGWILDLLVPVLFVIVLFQKEIFLVYGQTRPAPFYFLLLTGPILSCAFGLAGNMLLMTGHSRLLLVNSVAALLLNVVLNLLFIPRWGALGSGVAAAVTTLSQSMLQLWQARRVEGFSPRMAAFGRPLVSAALLAAAGVAISSLPAGTSGGHLAPGPFAIRAALAAVALGTYALFTLARRRRQPAP